MFLKQHRAVKVPVYLETYDDVKPNEDAVMQAILSVDPLTGYPTRNVESILDKIKDPAQKAFVEARLLRSREVSSGFESADDALEVSPMLSERMETYVERVKLFMERNKSKVVEQIDKQ